MGDLVIRDGRVVGMNASDPGKHPRGMVLPALSECHVHLDKCHTISRMNGVGGDLQSAIDAQARDRVNWTQDDLRVRAMRGLTELVDAGCNLARSHVDWSSGGDATEPPMAWHVLCDIADDMRGRVELQLAALIDLDELADPAIAEAIAKSIAARNGVFGAFVLDQPNRRDGIESAFRVADRFDLMLDFHVDEGLAPDLDGLELIADVAIATGHQGPILCGHACSLMNLNQSSLKKVSDKLLQAGITVASLPATNLFLQGRASGTPDRRGVTRIAELRAAGVPVVVGTDNVRDAFCPLGRHDPRQSLALAALAAHLDPPFGDYLPMISTSARTALGLAPIHVDDAAIGDLVLFDATSTSDLLASTSGPRPLAGVLQGAAP
ncbi:MAG: amidohydrolase family protein [Rhodospirillaceae bacterium]|nr:amidohydrolase family protein [Rhodospirillaceae bacterium]